MNQILIADAQLEDLNVLLAGLMPNTKVWLVQRNENAMSYIFKALAEPNLNKLHLLAHGVSGGILLGNKTLTATDFRRQFDGASQRDLDIAFWSCQTGAGAEGLAFVQAVAEVTGAKVSATSGLIGAADKNGSWELDVSVQPPFSEKARGEFGHVLIGSLIANSGDSILAADIISYKSTFNIAVSAGATLTGTAADIATVLGYAQNPSGSPFFSVSHDINVTVGDANPATSDAATLQQLADIVTAVPTLGTTRILSYTEINDTYAHLNVSGNSYIAGATQLTITDSSPVSVSQLDTLKTTTGFNVNPIKAQNITGTASALVTGAAYISSTLNTNVTIDDSVTAPTLDQLATIDAANGTGTLTYTKVSDTIANYLDVNGAFTANASKYITDGTNGTTAIAVNVTDVTGAVTISQLTTLDAKNGGVAAVTYAEITDAKAALAADTKYITGSVPVTVNDAASVSELNTIRGKNPGVAFTGLLTATVSDHVAATLATLTGTNNAYTITVTGSSVASDLKLIDAATTLAVGATGVATITGNETDIKDVVQTDGITKAPAYAVTVDSGTLSVANANIIDAANGNGVITATITAATRVSDLKTLTATGTTNAYNITIDAADASSPAADLKTIDGVTSVNVGAANVTTLTGSASDIKDVLLSATIDTTADVIADVTGTTALATDLTTINTNNGTGAIGTSTLTTITGSATEIHAAYQISMTGIAAANLTVDSGTPTVTQLNDLAGDTSGVVTASISGVASALASLTNASGSTPAYTITVNDESTPGTAAADLNILNGVTTVAVNASGVTKITGNADVIVTALGAGITHSPTVAIDATTGSLTVAQMVTALNNIGLAGVGTIKATITGSVSELGNLSLSGSNDITLIVSSLSGTEAAADLNAINDATTNPVTATDVTALTGTAAAIKTLLEQTLVTPTPTITLGTIASVVVNGTATALDLNYIRATIPGGATVTAPVNITEAYDTANLTTVITNALAITTGGAETIGITGGTISAADLNTITGLTSGAVTASLAVATPITDATVTALSNVDANDVINFSSTAVTADATALNALNTLADTKSYANLATITEDAATIGASAVEITN
ncbi:MAG: DUF4347 domain-containing protein, partial [Methylococcales bacterium]|nr:DUF4347 domain-containing protein [Methylococcales bacterium]